MHQLTYNTEPDQPRMENSSFIISKMILVETGTYNDMFSRPYHSHLDGQAVNVFREATDNGQNINSSVLSGLAGSILRPAAQPEGIAAITNGWDTRRFRFMMEIRHAAGLSVHGNVRQIVSGYTDHLGYSAHTGKIHLDQNMRFVINSVLTLRDLILTGPSGQYAQTTVSDSCQILNGQYQPGFTQEAVAARLMRPQDVFTQMQVGMLRDADTFDTRSTFAQGPCMSKRANNIAPTYLANVMTGYKQAMAESNSMTDSMEHILGKARGIVRDSLLSQDEFLSMLNRQFGYGQTFSVAYKDLCRLSPGLDSHVQVGLREGTRLAKIHDRGQTCYWQGANNETLMSTIITQSMPTIMMDTMLTKVSLLATNNVMGGEFVITVLGAQSFADGVDLSPYLTILINRLKTEVLRDLTKNNLITIEFELHADVLGESRITISVDSQPPVDFALPSFADAAFTPVMTYNYETLKVLASDLESLNDNIAGISHMTPSGPPMGDGSRLSHIYTNEV